MDSSGNRFTAEQLLEHSGWILKLARQLVGTRGSAEDLVQDTWLAVLERPPRIRKSLGAWLRGAIRHAAARQQEGDRDRPRRESRGARAELVPSAAELAERAQGQRLLAALVLELPEPYRSTLLLRYFGGLTHAEIARRQGTPVSTVRVHHHRALEELRKLLIARGKDDPDAWRFSSAVLVGSCVGTKAHAVASVGMGALIMSGKTKIALGIAALVALLVVTVWAPWQAIEADERASLEAGRNARAAADAAGPGAPRDRDVPAVGAAIAASSPDVGRSLIGRVVDAGGAPIAGASIVAVASNMTELVPRGAADVPKGWPRVTTTDADGRFAIEELAAAPSIEVLAEKEGWQPTLVTNPTVDAPILVKLARGITFRGRVRDFANAPIRGARIVVSALYGVARSEREAVSAADGTFELAGLGGAHRTFIEISADGFAPQWINYLPEPDASGSSTKEFYLGRGAEVTGVVQDVDTGAPIENARVVAWVDRLAYSVDRNTGTIQDPKQTDVIADVRTGPDGRFRVVRLPSWGVHPNAMGQYHGVEADLGGVVAIAGGYAPAVRRLDVPDEGAKEEIVLRCRPGTSVSGRVVDEQGSPVADARMWFHLPTPDDNWNFPEFLNRETGTWSRTDAAGSYVLRSVPSSTTGETDVVVTAWVDQSAQLLDRGEVSVRVAGRQPVRAPDLVLKKKAGGVVNMRILDPQGAPVWGARVDEGGPALAVTDRDGRARFTYPEFPTPDGTVAELPTVFVRATGHALARVKLQSSGELVVRLEPPRRISGRVTYPDGSPAEKVWVQAAEAEHPIEQVFPSPERARDAPYDIKGERIASTSSDANGAFELSQLPSGTYHVEARLMLPEQEFVHGTAAAVAADSADVRITVPRKPPQPRGKITVNVRERVSKRPVMRCTVSLKNEWRERESLPVAPGRFVAGGLEAGRWTVRVLAPRYAGTEQFEVVIPESTEPVVLDIDLDRGVVMRGRVKVAGVANFAGPRGWVSGPGAPTMRVTAEGIYEIAGLKAGASYDVSVSHEPRKDVWETFVSPTKMKVPDDAPDVVEKDLELVAGGSIGIRIKAPRMFDPLDRQPKSEEQWRIARESRMTIRSVDGSWSWEWKPVSGDNYGLQAPHGRYVARLEIPGVDPQEKTVTVSSELVYVDFDVP